jgi:hypothetical protein
MGGTPPVSCCAGSSQSACVFAKALLSRASRCELASRRAQGEQEVLECTSPVARINCGTLAALMHERSRFVLRLPGPGRPLMHQQAMRLQCGGLAALRETLDVTECDVHRLVATAHERHTSLMQLPWEPLVALIAAWTPRKRAAGQLKSGR